MPQIALHTMLKAGQEAQYEAIHETVPPDLAEALVRHGVRDWRIWRDGQHLFHLVDVDDYAAMRRGLRDHPANVRWQRMLAPLHEQPDDYSGEDTGVPLLWSLAEQLGRDEQD